MQAAYAGDNGRQTTLVLQYALASTLRLSQPNSLDQERSHELHEYDPATLECFTLQSMTASSICRSRV
jgi:hypothetical protein